ncbi:MAG: TfoX/Sxy family DNA transformation protein [Devosia sp.]|uniref:TfoX/Sxy family DNA transformation protein n=1 Tax=Devosia sp. TaxID=1871048 RepID=UPI001A497664|nr:TfoX/Sxy family DNA transformation protein [Devosia sp.]MBL8599472.1 TfoX/Sxy family DNA transformation protein [Devosia sp.]
MAAIEDSPNIGKVLGQRLRTVGIDTREKLEAMGDADAFRRLCARFPEDACIHTRLALAGAVRGIRWHDLPRDVQADVTRGLAR